MTINIDVNELLEILAMTRRPQRAAQTRHPCEQQPRADIRNHISS